MEFDIVMVLALIAAVVVFLQLRSVLGKRTGFERPPLDPYAQKKQNEADNVSSADIVELPKREQREPDDFKDIDRFAPINSDLNKGLRSLRKSDPSFAPQSFVDGVRVAYEMIVTAFANGDKKSLKPLLAAEVYDGFSDAIDILEKNNENVSFTFVGINKLEMITAQMVDKEEQITMRIVSEIISATYQKDETLIDGDPETIVEITDVWTFARPSQSNDPNWKLIATQDEE
ncbi:Tim44/TimA family putative adaptor protein [Bartonella tamiae]|uniref:Tim44-like domain-containing protein n=1 Tax=Bartonella tamiae Th239 TaxID=1094558 RepID=J1K285_9HYPH|nr:Tim44/TimA family putative adaptor protein [Bartonella tamiae]EJF91220.1 hypothetical protein ME5_00552 [Bartonella tamiae Th239]EJF93115.1 hypothetical protein MEG_01329 [Bartonella tamiae Th307]